MRYFLPWEPLPDCEAYGDSWVEMATGCRGAGNDSKCNAYSEAPTNLEDATKG